MQAVTLSGWFWKYSSSKNIQLESSLSNSSIHNVFTLWLHRDRDKDGAGIEYLSPQPIPTFAGLAVGFGLLGLIALFVKTLERKHKWCRRLVILCSAFQGISKNIILYEYFYIILLFILPLTLY